MATNMIHEMAQKLNIADVQKIDPNSDELTDHTALQKEEKLMQAGIPTVLAALYKYGMTERGANHLLSVDTSTNWMKQFLGANAQKAVDKVAAYAGASADTTASTLQKISIVAVDVLKKNLPENATDEQVFALLSAQRHQILAHLPAALQMGSLWDDSALDDSTNKMEGPVSNLMHAIENKLSSPSK